ncbi:hypothetical protein Alg130_07457 [Pyrenophora tritici-repentis]|nr:hypothetical protein Alg130_07457 [Pyrenophora tritici-repentis]
MVSDTEASMTTASALFSRIACQATWSDESGNVYIGLPVGAWEGCKAADFVRTMKDEVLNTMARRIQSSIGANIKSYGMSKKLVMHALEHRNEAQPIEKPGEQATAIPVSEYDNQLNGDHVTWKPGEEFTKVHQEVPTAVAKQLLKSALTKMPVNHTATNGADLSGMKTVKGRPAVNLLLHKRIHKGDELQINDRTPEAKRMRNFRARRVEQPFGLPNNPTSDQIYRQVDKMIGHLDNVGAIPDYLDPERSWIVAADWIEWINSTGDPETDDLKTNAPKVTDPVGTGKEMSSAKEDRLGRLESLLYDIRFKTNEQPAKAKKIKDKAAKTVDKSTNGRGKSAFKSTHRGKVKASNTGARKRQAAAQEGTAKRQRTGKSATSEPVAGSPKDDNIASNSQSQTSNREGSSVIAAPLA